MGYSARITAAIWVGVSVALFALNADIGIRADDKIPPNQQEITLSFAPLVKKASPAVVNVYATTVSKKPRTTLFNDPILERFFGEGFWRLFNKRPPTVRNSLGSGVIVHKDGIVVTSYHIIKGAKAIRIVSHDRREFAATVIGTDKKTDLAVLSIHAPNENFPALPFQDSDTLEVGDLVLAIGNPFGIGQTVTSGIVSALSRTSLGIDNLASFIQTDAAINPGNSGGALLDMHGKLVGINTAIFSKSGGSNGIGFAVPANMVRFVMDNIQKHGKVMRVWLGLESVSVNAEIAEALNLERISGALVNDLWPKATAERAGLERGDVIVALDNIPIVTAHQLRGLLARMPIGKRVSIRAIRTGKNFDTTMMLEPASAEPAPEPTLISNTGSPLNGAEIANISPALYEKLSLDIMRGGILITKIIPNSAAHLSGFKVKDRLISINAHKVTSVRELITHLLDANSWNIEILRGGKRHTLQYRR